jgi:hypothetical protein
VATYAPYGQPEMDADGLDTEWEVSTLRTYNMDEGDAVVCAESLSEFLFRFWSENEIARREFDGLALTEEQQPFVNHYANA